MSAIPKFTFEEVLTTSKDFSAEVIRTTSKRVILLAPNEINARSLALSLKDYPSSIEPSTRKDDSYIVQIIIPTGAQA